MSELKATPGPWAVNPFNAQVDAFDIGEPLPVCQLLWPTEQRTEATTEANARLIAAAPALYEALEALRLQVLQSDLNCPSNEYAYEALQMADAALSQARGESNG